MTDVNASESHSASRFLDEKNSSFVLNESNVPMEVDFDDQIYASNATKFNGHSSPSIEHDEQEEKEDDAFRPGRPILNKSFDVLPTVKDQDISPTQLILDNSTKNNNVLDTTVELSNNSVDFDENPMHDQNNGETVNTQELLSNQFSLEYPYVIPQPIENIPLSSSPPLSPTNPVETVTNLTKTMQLNMNKSVEGQDFSTSSATNDKTFDTNTFVLKKKERRKMTTPATETSLNTTSDVTSPDLMNKQSSFNTPSTSLDTAVASRPTTSQQQQQQQPLMDPTRIM